MKINNCKVNLHNGKILMAFAYDGNDDLFKENIEESYVRTMYIFDTVEDFIRAWNKMVEEPDGMWYWVIDMEKNLCICSGACDTYDIEIFEEYFGINKE